MKKYFMKESGEELHFGDMIEVDFTKEEYGKTFHHHLECKFIEPLIPVLVDNNIIVVKELEEFVEDDDRTEFDDVFDSLDLILDEVKQLKTAVKALTALLKPNTKTNAKASGK